MTGVPAPRHRLLSWITAGVLAIGFTATAWFAYCATRPAELKPLVRLGAEIHVLSPDRTRRPCVSNDRLFRPPLHVTFLLNFFDELRRKVPLSGK